MRFGFSLFNKKIKEKFYLGCGGYCYAVDSLNY